MKPTYEDCLKVISDITKDKKFTQEELEYRACLLYFINRIDFWEDFPILYKLIKLYKKLPEQ